MKKQANFLKPLYRLLVIVLVMLSLVLSPANAAQATSDRPSTENKQVRDTTSSDLSDIPNLEQMDYGTFEEHVGGMPSDRKPLFNPDNPKVQIKDKTPGSNRTITTEDLKEDK